MNFPYERSNKPGINKDLDVWFTNCLKVDPIAVANPTDVYNVHVYTGLLELLLARNIAIL